MFGGFDETPDAQAGKRWFASAGTSVVIFLLGGAGLVMLARQTAASSTEEPSIDVAFHAAPEPETKPEPPPPPPPPPKAGPKPKRPGNSAPPPPAVIPDSAPAETEPTERIDATAMQEEFGDGEAGNPPPVIEPPPPPPPLETRRIVPVFEDDPNALPPRALAGNALPKYPEQARHLGIEGDVILKIEISATGEVLSAKVLRGKEPFASAALAAVHTWHYAPATLDGRPVAFVRLVKIPFRLH